MNPCELTASVTALANALAANTAFHFPKSPGRLGNWDRNPSLTLWRVRFKQFRDGGKAIALLLPATQQLV